MDFGGFPGLWPFARAGEDAPMRWTALMLALALGCGDDDSTMDASMADGAMDASRLDGSMADSGIDAGTCMPRDPATLPDPGDCTPLPTDYAPCADDMWPECVSDSGEYVRIQDTISSIARVRAFEDIAALLFDPTTDPSGTDFMSARDIYQEPEGLDSRLVRRYDPHFDVPAGTDCTIPATAAMFPDYCVGPAILQPIVLDAFARGAAEEAPTRLHAARIEATLLWFLYVSAYKESLTCTTKAKDCDSSYAYYTGGEPARGGIGLARYVHAVDPYAHDRAWDGVLAVRCWRDIDSADTATDLELRDRARNQYDHAVLDGVAAIVADRLRKVASTTGDEQLYHWTFVQTLGQALDRSYQERDAASATAFASALEMSADAVDAVALADAIDAAYDCP